MRAARAPAWARVALHAAVGATATLAALLAGDPARASESLGTWLTADEKAKVELRECGGDGLCSEIVWLKEPLDENGRPWRDQLNPEPKLRRRPVIGLDILIGLKKIAPQTWSGEIYDPEQGKKYYLKHIVVGRDQVEIRGCMPVGWPCRSKYWTRTSPVRPAAEPPLQVAKRQQPPAVAQKRPAPAKAPQTAQPPARAPAQAPVQRQAALTKAPPAPGRPPGVEPPARKPPRPAPPPAQAVLPWQSHMARADERPSPRTAPATTGALPRPMTAAPPQPAGSVYLVQVTAGQDQNEALKTFGKLQRRFPELLGGYLPNVKRVDLGSKGIWYRVRVGPMERHTAARSFCDQLKAAGGDCLVRKD